AAAAIGAAGRVCVAGGRDHELDGGDRVLVIDAQEGKALRVDAELMPHPTEIPAIIRIAIAVSVVGTSERRSDQGAGSQPDANAAPAPTAPAPTAPCVSWAGQRQRGCPNQCSSHSSSPYYFQHRDLLSPPKSLTMKTATY